MNDFVRKAGVTVDKAMLLKSRMIERNLTAAKAKCPHCPDGYWHARLAPKPRQHLRLWCDSCDVSMME